MIQYYTPYNTSINIDLGVFEYHLRRSANITAAHDVLSMKWCNLNPVLAWFLKR